MGEENPSSMTNGELQRNKKMNENYFNLTNTARGFAGDYEFLVEKWLNNKSTIDFLKLWEQKNNPDFNFLEFEKINAQIGLNHFWLSVQRWVELTNGIGLICKTEIDCRTSTFAHHDICLEFLWWVSPEFRLIVIKKFQENSRLEPDELMKMEN